MRDEIARVNTLVPATYASDAWQKVLAARDAAQALVNVRIYSIGDVNNVKNATAALTARSGTTRPTTATGDVGGSVPATLALTLGAPATLRGVHARRRDDYTASTTANVISTAGDAALSVSDPGHLTNGAFSLAEPLRVRSPRAVDRAGLQRPGDDHVPPAHRRDEAAAHRHLLQDADVHAVDHDALSAGPARRPGRRAASVEVLAHGLEVGVAGAAAPLGGDDLAAPLGDALDVGARSRTGRSRRPSGGARGPSRPVVGSGSSISTPSPASSAVSQARISSRWWAGVCVTSPASSAAAYSGSSSGPIQRPACSHVSCRRATNASRCVAAAAGACAHASPCDAVRALLLEDLLRARGHRLDARVHAGGDERRQHAVDEQVGGDERVPVGQLVVEQREPLVAAEAVLVGVSTPSALSTG